MCGRFNIIDDPLAQLIMEITGVTTGWSFTTEYNIAPTQSVPVLRQVDGEWDLALMRWWLVPYWAKEPATKYSMFNAKSETLTKSRAFKEPFQRQRCIVPASGYYEWIKEGTLKLPQYVEPADQPGFAFAGLWDRWKSDDQVIESCTIITTAAPEGMTQIHHRMPVHLYPEEARTWVSSDTAKEDLELMFAPKLRGELKITPVSTYVNNARNKDDRCLEPLEEPFLVGSSEPH